METLEAAYALWDEERARQAAAIAGLEDERRRLEDDAAFRLGAVRAAAEVGGGEGGLAKANALAAFVQEGEARIARAKEALSVRAAAEAETSQVRLTALKLELLARIDRFAARVRPHLKLLPRRLSAELRILHVERISPDEAVLLLRLLTGKIPSRYGFLHDDSTDEVGALPALLYPDEGVDPALVRPDPARLRCCVLAEGAVLPIKGALPFLVGEAFYRLLPRGPVMELELAQGDTFRSLLSPEEAERAAGHFIRLKLEGRIELTLATG